MTLFARIAIVRANYSSGIVNCTTLSKLTARRKTLFFNSFIYIFFIDVDGCEWACRHGPRAAAAARSGTSPRASLHPRPCRPRRRNTSPRRSSSIGRSRRERGEDLLLAERGVVTWLVAGAGRLIGHGRRDGGGVEAV